MFAVLRATPGSATSSSIVSGTLPPCSATMCFAAPMIFLALFRKNPVERISFSRMACFALAKCAAVGYFPKRDGVTMLTRASVHWAERIVATSSWNGSSCRSAVRLSG